MMMMMTRDANRDRQKPICAGAVKVAGCARDRDDRRAAAGSRLCEPARAPATRANSGAHPESVRACYREVEAFARPLARPPDRPSVRRPAR